MLMVAMKLKPELRISLQCNPVNTATNRPKKKIGRINVVTALTRVFLQENVWRFLPGSQKKWP